MIETKEHGEWIKKAQRGDKECLNRLAEAARVHLHEYVRRLTLEEDLTQDIVQECILEMFKIFHKLKNVERFRAWLDGIAFNKIRSHYGRQWRHRTVSLSKTGFDLPAEDSQMVVADMVHKELKEIIFQSMRELEPRHRAILALRCYRDMPYSEIARLMGCTEFGAQSLFYRAKKALARKLSHHGLGKSYLLAALVLFGKLTATTEAAAAKISVTAATVHVSTAASLAAVVTSQTAVVSLTAAAVIAGGAAAITFGTDKLDKKINLLKRLNKSMEAGKLAKLVPQTAKQIEQLTNLKMPSRPAEAEGFFSNPMVLFVNDGQREVIEKALSAAEGGEKRKALRRAAALAQVAEDFLENSELKTGV